MANNAVALLLIGGSGLRYGSVPPKQFQNFEGKPLFLHAAETISFCFEKIVYVCHPDYLRFAKQIVEDAKRLRDEDVFIEGGESRQDSTLRGLLYLEKEGLDANAIVIVNDGNRPFVTKEMLDECYQKADRCGAAVTAYRSTDSVLISREGLYADFYENRDEVYIVQTPQAFRFSLLLESAKKAKENGESFTDEGSMVIALSGKFPAIVEGSVGNIKITTKEQGDSL